jgi:NADH:ubiquinone oxidoreductase subunit F (NADH-binding)
MTVAGELRSELDAFTGAAAFKIGGLSRARLLAGPDQVHSPETLDAHFERLGPLRLPAGGDEALHLAAASGLTGRGGGEFPYHRKLQAALNALSSPNAAMAGGEPLIVVNGAEGEPASRKDGTLLELRPHVVLDGATWAAAATGSTRAVVFLEPGRRGAWETMRTAVLDRRRAGVPGPEVELAAAPDRFIAGESSAVVAALEGRGALPTKRPVPVAVSGVGGCPTLVSNTETVAHLGLIGRFGAEWFRTAGSVRSPGSTLVTLAGAVAFGGLVVEIVDTISVGALLTVFGGVRRPPAAVLVGGYSGHWVAGRAIWDTPVDRAVLRAAGCGLGCGLVAPLGEGACGLELTCRLVEYLAGESSGQCGSCVLGLPMLAQSLRSLLAGNGGRRARRHLLSASLELEGKGGCGHPDGVIGLVQSALVVFADDADRHARGRGCAGEANPGWFPVPRRGEARA